jgi:tetratricopeptide (TPR) repeat protein
MTRQSLFYLSVLLFSLVGLSLLPACRACEITSLIAKGTEYQNNGEYDKALECYNRMIELEPEYFLGYAGRGEIYSEFARYDEAIADFDTAIRLNPEDDEAYFEKGQVLEKLGDYTSAVEYYSKAIERKPDNGYYYLCRGSIYRRTDRMEEAMADYRKSCGLGETTGCEAAEFVWKEMNKKR